MCYAFKLKVKLKITEIIYFVAKRIDTAWVDVFGV